MHQNVIHVPHALHHLVFFVVSLGTKRLAGTVLFVLLAALLSLHRKI